VPKNEPREHAKYYQFGEKMWHDPKSGQEIPVAGYFIGDRYVGRPPLTVGITDSSFVDLGNGWKLHKFISKGVPSSMGPHGKILLDVPSGELVHPDGYVLATFSGSNTNFDEQAKKIIKTWKD
jgi:hypothetical protein